MRLTDLYEQPDGDAPALVVVVNNLDDLERVRRDHWYRIPQRRAPPQVAAEYLAFYQTAAFPLEERWQIRWTSPVRGYYLASRRDLIPEEPHHPRADDLYYRVTVGPLTALPHPIPSRRLRRITFIPTTLGRLYRAAEINDLWIRTDAHELLWQALQQADLEAECCFPVGEAEHEYNLDLALPCRDGKVAVMIEPDMGSVPRVGEAHALAPTYLLSALGWTAIQLLPAEIERNVAESVGRIAALCATLGGLK